MSEKTLTDAEKHRFKIAFVPWGETTLPVAALHDLPEGTLVDERYGCAAYRVAHMPLHADQVMFVRVLAFPDGSEPHRPAPSLSTQEAASDER